LTDEGEKERTKTSVACTRKTLLAQAEITSDISAKQLKNNAEVVCKETSLLHPHQVSGNVWTMNGKYVTVYTETGVKVFAKDPS
jgi:other hect domain ubiquitin protein ligase E3